MSLNGIAGLILMPTFAASPAPRHRLQRLDHEPDAVLHAAAVAVGARVGDGGQELHRQVARGRVQLDAVEAGGQRVPRRLREPSMMPGISFVSIARGWSKSWSPCASVQI
jgi:hypothetical protein